MTGIHSVKYYTRIHDTFRSDTRDFNYKLHAHTKFEESRKETTFYSTLKPNAWKYCIGPETFAF